MVNDVASYHSSSSNSFPLPKAFIRIWAFTIALYWAIVSALTLSLIWAMPKLGKRFQTPGPFPLKRDVKPDFNKEKSNDDLNNRHSPPLPPKLCPSLRHRRRVVLSLTIPLPPSLNGFKPLDGRMQGPMTALPLGMGLTCESPIDTTLSSPDSTPIRTPSSDHHVSPPNTPSDPPFFCKHSRRGTIPTSNPCLGDGIKRRLRPRRSQTVSNIHSSLPRTNPLVPVRPFLPVSAHGSYISPRSATGTKKKVRWKRLSALTTTIETSFPTHWSKSKDGGARSKPTSPIRMDRHAVSLSFASTMGLIPDRRFSDI